MLNANLHYILIVVLFTSIVTNSYAEPETVLPQIEKPLPQTAKKNLDVAQKNHPAFTLEQLENIQVDTLLLEARASRARALQSLQQQQQQNGQTLISSVFGEKELLDRANYLPRIIEIVGRGRSLSTRLMLISGLSIEAREGQKIPSTHFTVKRISAHEVQIITSEGEVHTLPFLE